MKEKLSSGIWTLENFALNLWKIYVEIPSAGYITMAGAGSNVTTELAIPFAHRWNSTHFRHAKSTDADCTDALNIVIRRPKLKNTPPQFEEDMFNETGIKTPKITETWGEKFEREASVYDIVLNSTLNDRVYPVFYIQRLEG